MKPSTIFTRRVAGLDYNVWITMIVLILLSAGLFSYTLINRESKETCDPLDIYVNGRTVTDTINLHTGDPVSFRIAYVPDTRVTWDFGDGVTGEEGFHAIHTYKQEAVFTVRASINNECVYTRKITVKTPVIIPEYGEDIIGENEAFTGEVLEFTTARPAKNYEWYIENNANFPKQSGSKASFKFKLQGNYVVTLVLDQDRQKKYSKTVVVQDDPLLNQDIKRKPLEIPADPGKVEQPKDTQVISLPETPRRPATKVISDDNFRSLVQSVVCEKMISSDFKQYLCDGDNTVVVYNGKRTTFGAMCAEVKGKKLKVESVVAGRDNDNCVTSITVTVDKKGWLGKNPCK
ncbi:PKD domain-containing protein [Paraflavitalea pollutisoli]|uniref:PKD domain-containing protein n=1 Tax=Paraflavitalea pollutisoli TaxID=3034143 RepID=UPI0023EB7C67|nr:PKD domain-containing protein [Paraflavitalea sp. H1-2-19X]